MNEIKGELPPDYAMRLALEKAQSGPADQCVIAADTIVHRDGVLYDKPKDRTEAFAHLSTLQGGWHQVTTAVCVRFKNAQKWFPVHTAVCFRPLTPNDIHTYLATGDADDKAGAYGIQGPGSALIAEINGSWTNVMGLPLPETLEAIREVRAEHS